MKKIRIGTRGSKLALWQADYVGKLLQKQNPKIEIEIKIIKTTGDIKLDVSLAKIGGKGLFVKEIEEALLNDDIDIAVHSMKDMPAFLPDGLEIHSILKREDPRDVIVGSTLKNLKKEATIGTSSLRRLTQLKNKRPDLIFKELRGNVDTRILKQKKGEFDAIILAAAGLIRLGLENVISEKLDLIPAIGQGAIGIEAKNSDKKIISLLKQINHQETFDCVTIERAFLKVMQASCQVPLGCHAFIKKSQVVLEGFVSSVDGKKFIHQKKEISLDKAILSSQKMAEDILDSGGREILEELI